MQDLNIIKELLLKRQKETLLLINKVKKSLQKAPPGSLVLSKSNGRRQYYHKYGTKSRNGKYIPGKNRKLAAALAQKEYDRIILQEAEKEISILDSLINRIPDDRLIKVYSQMSDARQELVVPYILSDEQYVKRWESVEYQRKSISGDKPVLLTERGEYVRSKSEKILADKFFSLGIPYRYEYPLKINGYGVVYPDFMLLNIRTKQEYYFEHFGMMDNPDYCQKALLKLDTYVKNGIIPGKNILISYESSKKVLDMTAVEYMLQEYIL